MRLKEPSIFFRYVIRLLHSRLRPILVPRNGAQMICLSMISMSLKLLLLSLW